MAVRVILSYRQMAVAAVDIMAAPEELVNWAAAAAPLTQTQYW